jgi:hypothetical protein
LKALEIVLSKKGELTLAASRKELREVLRSLEATQSERNESEAQVIALKAETCGLSEECEVLRSSVDSFNNAHKDTISQLQRTVLERVAESAAQLAANEKQGTQLEEMRLALCSERQVVMDTSTALGSELLSLQSQMVDSAGRSHTEQLLHAAATGRATVER